MWGCVIQALKEAAQRGKQVAVLVEITARFDEAPNISWGKELEEAGAYVAYGVERVKTRVKLALVVREEPDGIRRYVHVGTGNYHEGTARLYEDLGLPRQPQRHTKATMVAAAHLAAPGGIVLTLTSDAGDAADDLVTAEVSGIVPPCTPCAAGRSATLPGSSQAAGTCGFYPSRGGGGWWTMAAWMPGRPPSGCGA